CARANLNSNGRFVVELSMPNLATFADSGSRPPRILVEMDIDHILESEGVRLIRRKTTHYLAHRQQAHTRFLYEKYKDGRYVDGYIDDFTSHVYFPRELQLLFQQTGFDLIERA